MIELSPEEEKLILIRRLGSTILWGGLCQKAIENGVTKIEADKVDTHLWKVVLITDDGRYMAMGNTFPEALTAALLNCKTDREGCRLCGGDGESIAFLSGRKFKCPGCKGSGKK